MYYIPVTRNNRFTSIRDTEYNVVNNYGQYSKLVIGQHHINIFDDIPIAFTYDTMTPLTDYNNSIEANVLDGIDLPNMSVIFSYNDSVRITNNYYAKSIQPSGSQPLPPILMLLYTDIHNSSHDIILHIEYAINIYNTIMEKIALLSTHFANYHDVYIDDHFDISILRSMMLLYAETKRVSNAWSNIHR